MTASFTRAIRQAGLVLAFAVSFSALSSSSSFAFSPEAQQMCTGDAFRLCSSEIPNIPRITACMMKQRANLSSGCRAISRKPGNSPLNNPCFARILGTHGGASPVFDAPP